MPPSFLVYNKELSTVSLPCEQTLQWLPCTCFHSSTTTIHSSSVKKKNTIMLPVYPALKLSLESYPLLSTLFLLCGLLPQAFLQNVLWNLFHDSHFKEVMQMNSHCSNSIGISHALPAHCLRLVTLAWVPMVRETASEQSNLSKPHHVSIYSGTWANILPAFSKIYVPIFQKLYFAWYV